MSSVVNVACQAAEETTSVNVTVLDSRQLSLATGFLVETAAALAAQGRSISKIMTSLNKQIRRSHVLQHLILWSS